VVTGAITAIGLGPSGEIFLGSEEPGEGLFELDESGGCVNACAPIAVTTVTGLAVDQASGDILVAETWEWPAGAGFDPSASLGSCEVVAHLCWLNVAK
jgi:hypothetical protein